MKGVLLWMLACVTLASGAAAESTSDRFGAIALNLQTRGVGIGWNFPEEWQARNEALRRCGWGDCKVHLISKNACGALVVDFAKNIIGVATYPVSTPNSRDKATDRAVYECKSRGGDCRNHKNIAWVCAGEPWGQGEANFEKPETPTPAPDPSITVQWSGDDAFLVKGVHFTPAAHVFLKVSGKGTSLDTIAIDFHRRSIRSAADGTLSVRTGRVCNTGVQGDVTFIANDTKKGQTKPVTLRCRAGVNPPDIRVKPKP